MAELRNCIVVTMASRPGRRFAVLKSTAETGTRTYMLIEVGIGNTLIPGTLESFAVGEMLTGVGISRVDPDAVIASEKTWPKPEPAPVVQPAPAEVAKKPEPAPETAPVVQPAPVAHAFAADEDREAEIADLTDDILYPRDEADAEAIPDEDEPSFRNEV